MERKAALIRLYRRFVRLHRRAKSDGEGRVSLLLQLILILLRVLLSEISFSLYVRICMETFCVASASRFVNLFLLQEEWDSKVIHVVMNFLVLCFSVDVSIRALDALGIPASRSLRALRVYMMTGSAARRHATAKQSEERPDTAVPGSGKLKRNLVWLAAFVLSLAAFVSGAAAFYLSGLVPALAK